MNGALTSLFEKLWDDFQRINPQAEAIHELLTKQGNVIVNDHVAFRTFDDPRVNIDVLAAPFVDGGYRAADTYRFDSKKLNARHYEHPDPDAPKVFISELELKAFSPTLQEKVARLLDQLPADASQSPTFCVSGRPWDVSHADYLKLAEESEYAGWMSAFGFRANHFTVLVNRLNTVRTLEDLNTLVKSAGFPLNKDGGEIKGSPADLLEQSSTLASQIPVNFQDGTFTIPGCYYEFARRYPREDGMLFSGFVTKSADKIFQSTDRRG